MQENLSPLPQRMRRYRVHVYCIVRVPIEVQAHTAREAARLAVSVPSRLDHILQPLPTGCEWAVDWESTVIVDHLPDQGETIEPTSGCSIRIQDKGGL